jgi:hypothetical protein
MLVAFAIVAGISLINEEPAGAGADGVVVMPPAVPAPRTPESTSEPLQDGQSSDDAGEDGSDDFVDMQSPSRPTPTSGKPVNQRGWETSAVAGRTNTPDSAPVTCPDATTEVSTAQDLAAALTSVKPGETIHLADGTYRGHFVASITGTADEPIFLCGGPGAVLEGDGVKGGYVLHLDGVSSWRLVGFTIRNGQKGLMADAVADSHIQGLTITQIGDEALHLRRGSVANVVQGNNISRTGLRREKFGEGVYVGTAVSNWCQISGCVPDRSDRNVIKGNRISQTTAEAVDVKEGTTGGLVVDNTFDGSALTGADSWVDVKGNAWLVKANRGSSSPLDGYQTHEILEGWGARNVFEDNVADVRGAGYGFAFRPENGNQLACSNKATAADKGLATIDCR